MSSKIFRQIFCLIIFSQAEFLTVFFDTTIRQNTTQFFDSIFRHDMTRFFDTIFRQNILYENVVEIYCRRSLSKNIVEVNYLTSKNLQHFSTKNYSKLQFFSPKLYKFLQISTDFYRILQNFTNFFRAKLRLIINKQSQEFAVEMCRKILSNYNSTSFFASVFRQEFSPRFFDSKFRQHLTNFNGNRQIFCRLL